jgi:hypothetical protein
MIITNPDPTTTGHSTILYGHEHAHRDGQVNNLSSMWERGSSSTDHFAANADFVHLGAPGDPNDTRDWADMKELAQHNRSTPDDLQLAGGHVFGENTQVPLPAVVTHRDEQALLGAIDNASSQIPDEADPADVTDLAEPFEIPTIGLNRPPEDHAAFDSSDEEEDARPTKRRNTRVVAEDGTANQADDNENDGSCGFWSSGSDDDAD